MGFLEVVAGALAVLEVIGVLPRIRRHVTDRPSRVEKAQLYAQLAKDVVAAVRLHKGVSANQSAIIDASVDMLIERLSKEGVKKQNRKEMALRLVSGALAEVISK